MKRAIITGANQGIGYSMVCQLLADGWAVTVLDVEIDRLEELQTQYADRLLPLRCNVKEEAAMTEAVGTSVAQFGGVDVAVHNACICTFKPLEETEYSVFAEVLDVNYLGAVRLTKTVLPHMTAGGRVLFASSGVGVTGFVNISPYAASKGAIEAFAKCMNNEYRAKGITFHIYHPPLTRTHSASGLPVPKEFMADPVKVGVELARQIHKKGFIICHSFGQALQTRICYLFPIGMGRLLSKMTANAGSSRELQG